MGFARILSLMSVLISFWSLTSAGLAQDVEGGKDHALLSRMPNYFIAQYDAREFDRLEFPVAEGDRTGVEGKVTVILYQIKEGSKLTSPLQIVRNCQNALSKLGGKVLHERIEGAYAASTIQIKKGAQETWVEVIGSDSGFNYRLSIVEKGDMKQDVVGAETWDNDIKETGRTAVYGIHFDTDKADLKPESDETLKEIAKLLSQDASLRLWVVGHTDASGDISRNMPLSEARAKAVVTALTTKHGVAVSRLSGYGVGPLCPVAPNDTEEGRAKNRRVELVKH